MSLYNKTTYIIALLNYTLFNYPSKLFSMYLKAFGLVSKYISSLFNLSILVVYINSILQTTINILFFK